MFCKDTIFLGIKGEKAGRGSWKGEKGERWKDCAKQENTHA